VLASFDYTGDHDDDAMTDTGGVSHGVNGFLWHGVGDGRLFDLPLNTQDA